MIISVFHRKENIVEKGEIAYTSNFSFSHNVFKRLLSQTRLKKSFSGNCLIWLDNTTIFSPGTDFTLYQTTKFWKPPN